MFRDFYVLSATYYTRAWICFVKEIHFELLNSPKNFVLPHLNRKSNKKNYNFILYMAHFLWFSKV